MHLQFFILSLFAFMVSPTSKDDVDNSAFMKFIEQVSQVNKIEDLKPLVDPEAYLAFNSEYKSYYEVLSSDELRQQVNDILPEKVNVAKSRIDDESGAGFIFLTGVSKSGQNVNHTFCVFKDKKGKWKITHWQAG